MQELTLTSPPEATKPRRGRPPGARNKRTEDLAKYVAATYGGMTPGQQSAAMCMVSPKDLKAARRLARELQIVDIDLSPLMLAMVVKAKQLSRAIGCSTAEAWVILSKERSELMPYVHQRRAIAPVEVQDAPLPGVLVMEAAPGQDIELPGDFDDDAFEVAPAGSHDDAQDADFDQETIP